jgi:hypothetical protein
MTAQGGTLCSAWLRVPPQNRRAIFPMCYGIQFAELPKNRRGPTALYRVNRFDQICRAHDIEHRLTKPNHRWTNGQVERMNRTLKEATVIATTTTATTNCGNTSPPSWMPTTSPGGSRPYVASRHTRRHAEPGQTIQIASDTIRPISPRD